MKVTIRFEVIEALRFATGHTGGVEVYSKELVAVTPLPSTVLGALGAAVKVQLGAGVCGEPCADLKKLAGELSGRDVDILAESCEEPVIWGPLVAVGDKYYFARGGDLIDVGRRDDYVRSAQGLATPLRGQYSFKPLLRFGIRLSERKVAELGLAYRASFYGYGFKPYPASLIYAASLADEVATRLRTGAVRLGGEGRVARLLSMELPEDLRELLSGRGEYAIALSPVLFYAEGETVLGLRDIESVLGVPFPSSVKLKAETVGLGFSEVCGKRRPLLQALPPGTVLKLKDGGARAVGLFSCLGYGSLLRVQA